MQVVLFCFIFQCPPLFLSEFRAQTSRNPKQDIGKITVYFALTTIYKKYKNTGNKLSI